jgi:hypothetical protein
MQVTVDALSDEILAIEIAVRKEGNLAATDKQAHRLWDLAGRLARLQGVLYR